jgi:hypothetical protein
MRRVVVVVLLSVLAQATAFAGADKGDKGCRISLKGTSFDIRCLPAMSARGTLVAVPVIDPDGERGLPNLQVLFFPIDGRAPGSTIVLTVAEVEELGGAQMTPALAEKIEPRLDLVNAQLSVPGFAPLRAIGFARDVEAPNAFLADGGLQLELTSGSLEIRGRGVESDSVPLPKAAQAECEEANAPFPSGMWTSASDDREIVVRVDFAGSAACPAPRTAWRVLHVRGASTVDPAKQASALNTRAMRKFRARDWAGAAADFRAAIDSFSGHVKAHYNLACLASITKDRDTAVEQLRWLAASDLAEAEAKLVKARTDPDLTFVRNDPKVQEILAAGR